MENIFINVKQDSAICLCITCVSPDVIRGIRVLWPQYIKYAIIRSKNMSCYLTSCGTVHTYTTPLYRIRTRATALTNTLHVSPTCVSTSNTASTSHMRTRTCGGIHYTRTSHVMCANTLLSLTHLHHAPSGAYAQLTHLYTVMCEMIPTHTSRSFSHLIRLQVGEL